MPEVPDGLDDYEITRQAAWVEAVVIDRREVAETIRLEEAVIDAFRRIDNLRDEFRRPFQIGLETLWQYDLHSSVSVPIEQDDGTVAREEARGHMWTFLFDATNGRPNLLLPRWILTSPPIDIEESGADPSESAALYAEIVALWTETKHILVAIPSQLDAAEGLVDVFARGAPLEPTNSRFRMNRPIPN